MIYKSDLLKLNYIIKFDDNISISETSQVMKVLLFILMRLMRISIHILILLNFYFFIKYVF